jgi:DNA-binding SARP family transcriptional activator/tetratricopeptide (TPR) repeat protein
MATGHHLRLFGSVELLGPDGYPVRLRSRKQLALLVYLVFEARDHLIERSHLVDLFWGEVEHAKGRHSLAQALTAIRTVLGPQALNRSQNKVQLRAGLATDLDSLVPGAFRPEVLTDPLPELEGCGGRSFALWIETVRDRCLTRVRRRLAADLAEARRAGLVQDAREAATLLHALDPANELAALVVAEQAAADGDVDGAISILRRHVALAKECGRCPSDEMTGFRQRLERGLFRMLGDPEVAATASLPQARPEVFVGRERELTGLESQWSRAQDGRLVTALVTGAGGVGKSTLLRRFATGIGARGWPVCIVRCQEIGGSIPFAAVSELILQLARDPAFSGTDPRWLAEASRVAPALRSVYTGIPEAQPTPAEAVRLRVADALVGILEAVRDGGRLLLAIDDVHFMDPASRAVIHVLARRLESTPTMLVATADAGDTGRVQRETSNLLAWQGEIVLENLSPEGVAGLVRTLASRLPSVGADICDKIGELSQGNPYLAEMLLSDWHNNGANSLAAAELDPVRTVSDWRPSGAMRRAFKRQYQYLSDNSKHMLHLLAVAGRAVSVSEVRELLDLEQLEMDRAVMELVDRSTVRVWGDALAFRNDPHRAFVYFQMPEEARTYYHARLAESLTESGGGEDFQRHLEASHHFVKAGMVNDAVESVCIGADLAVTRGAPKEAERALQVVLSSSTQMLANLQVHLARALAAEGRFKEALRSVAAGTSGKLTGYEAAVGAAARVEALHRGRLGDDSTIRDALRYALTITQASGNAILSMRILQIAAEIGSETGSKRALASIRRKVGQIRYGANNLEVAALAQLTQGYCLLVGGAVRKAVLQFLRAHRMLKKLSLEPETRQALNGLGIAYYFLGSFQESIASFQQAIECAASIGDSVAGATSWSNLGAVYEDLGQFSLAQESYENAFEHESVASNPRRSVEVNLNLASLMMLKGDLTQAAECLEVARDRVVEAGPWWLFTDLCLCEADLCLFQSNPEQAWQLIMRGQANAKNRMYLLSDMTRMERLTRHHIWATQGVRAMQDSRSRDDLARRCVKLSGRLEILAFEQWILEKESIVEKSRHDVLEELKVLQLNGVITRITKIQQAYALS